MKLGGEVDRELVVAGTERRGSGERDEALRRVGDGGRERRGDAVGGAEHRGGEGRAFGVEAERRERRVREQIDDDAAGVVVLGGIEGERDALRDGLDFVRETQGVDGLAGVERSVRHEEAEQGAEAAGGTRHQLRTQVARDEASPGCGTAVN